MASRPSALDALDGAPTSLPHGTEVTTRVERLHGDRRLPQGLVGRIARERDGGFDVHVVGVSSQAAGHMTLVPALRAALDALGRPDILIVVGGVVPPDDYEALRQAGAVAVFGPGTAVPVAAAELLALISRNLGLDG